MRPPTNAGPRFLDDHDCVLVSGHMVRREVVRTVGLEETRAQLVVIQARKAAAAMKNFAEAAGGDRL